MTYPCAVSLLIFTPAFVASDIFWTLAVCVARTAFPGIRSACIGSNAFITIGAVGLLIFAWALIKITRTCLKSVAKFAIPRTCPALPEKEKKKE